MRDELQVDHEAAQGRAGGCQRGAPAEPGAECRADPALGQAVLERDDRAGARRQLQQLLPQRQGLQRVEEDEVQLGMGHLELFGGLECAARQGTDRDQQDVDGSIRVTDEHLARGQLGEGGQLRRAGTLGEAHQ